MMLIRTRWLKLSRRGAFLTLFGIVFVLLGYSYLSIPAASKPLLNAYLHTALSVAPIEVYGWGWIICGACAIVGGLWHRFDVAGFSAAAFMPVLWSIVYWTAQLADHIPRAWVNACIFTLLGLAILLVAGMADPLDNGQPRRPWWPR